MSVRMHPPARLDLRWPQSFATVVEKVVSEDIISEILGQANVLAEHPNFWLPKEEIVDNTLLLMPVEKAIRQAYNNTLKALLPEYFSGAEWWIQVYQMGKGLAFHFDKDETLFKERQMMKHPILSSVLYLTGSTADEKTRLGPTAVINQTFDNNSQRVAPEHPDKIALIWPRQGSLAVFDGRLGHGVLDSSTGERRVTLLINWWSYQPQAVHRPPPELSRTADGITESLEGLGLGEAPQEVQPVAKGCSQKRKALAVSCIFTPAPEDAVTIDDLMESYNLSCTGDSAVDVVAIEHKGYHLYPVGIDDGEQFDELVTAAAFVPMQQ